MHSIMSWEGHALDCATLTGRLCHGAYANLIPCMLVQLVSRMAVESYLTHVHEHAQRNCVAKPVTTFSKLKITIQLPGRRIAPTGCREQTLPAHSNN